MTTFEELLHVSLYKDSEQVEEAEVIAELTGRPGPVEDVIDVGLLQVGVTPTAPIGVFIEYMADRLLMKTTMAPMDLDRLAQGPSYIELGAWVGGQREALILMAIGKHHKAWDIITPATLGFEGEEAKNMMGMGLLLISGLNEEVRTLIEKEMQLDVCDKATGYHSMPHRNCILR